MISSYPSAPAAAAADLETAIAIVRDVWAEADGIRLAARALVHATAWDSRAAEAYRVDAEAWVAEAGTLVAHAEDAVGALSVAWSAALSAARVALPAGGP